MSNRELPIRKQIRLREYDYNSHGAYFITICTKGKAKVLSHISVGTTIGRPPTVVLTEYGRIVKDAIHNIPVHYPSIHVDNYVIMPNHVHMILFLQVENGRAMLVPTISVVIQQMKGFVSKTIGHSIWQSRFYDHVIRNDRDYREIWQYIENKYAKWSEDKYYI